MRVKIFSRSRTYDYNLIIRDQLNYNSETILISNIGGKTIVSKTTNNFANKRANVFALNFSN